MEYDDLLHPAQLGRSHLDAGSPLAHVAQLHHRIFYENPFTSELNVNPGESHFPAAPAVGNGIGGAMRLNLKGSLAEYKPLTMKVFEVSIP